jgi:hypothetical protein
MDVVLHVDVRGAQLLTPPADVCGAPNATFQASVTAENRGSQGAGVSRNALKFSLFNRLGHKVYLLTTDQDPSKLDCFLLAPGATSNPMVVNLNVIYEAMQAGEPYRLVCEGLDTHGEQIFTFHAQPKLL